MELVEIYDLPMTNYMDLSNKTCIQKIPYLFIKQYGVWKNTITPRIHTLEW